MAVYATRPRLSIEALPFLSAYPQQRQPYLSDDERQAFRAPIALPPDSYSQIRIDDNLDQASFRIILPNVAHKSFTTARSLRVRYIMLLGEGNIVVIRDRAAAVFYGYITSVQPSGQADGTADLQISGGAIDEAIRLQSVLIDTANRPSDSALMQRPDRVSGSQRGSLRASISGLLAATRAFRSPDGVIAALMDWSIKQPA